MCKVQTFGGDRESVTIDIMMPYYGDPGLLRTSVESVLRQTDPDWRLVVIDDVYPDLAPGRWVASIDDPRVEYRRNAVNLGVNGNFQESIHTARADFVTVMGCDDIMLPNYVARMHETFAAFPTASYVQPGVVVIDAAGVPANPLPDRVKSYFRKRITRGQVLSGEALAASLLKGNWTYFPSICWRREVVQSHGFQAKLNVALDLALQLDIVLDGGTLVYDPVATFMYRRHTASVSSWSANDGSRFEEERDVLRAAAERTRAVGWNRAARAATFHLSSRLNALTRMPSAVAARDGSGFKSLLRHLFA